MKSETITYTQIAEKAYELYEDRCRKNESGSADEDWLSAESTLLGELKFRRDEEEADENPI